MFSISDTTKTPALQVQLGASVCGRVLPQLIENLHFYILSHDALTSDLSQS